MIDWMYWRWEIARNLPIALVVASVLAGIGWVAINALPMKYSASSRVVLERTIGLSGRSKAQRTTEEVQHLQLVVHAMKSDAAIHPNDASYDVKIETSRDKPTYLLLEASGRSAANTVDLVQSLTTQSITVSDDAQMHQANTALEGFRAQLKSTQLALKQAREALSTQLNNAPTVTIDHLRARAAELRNTLRNAPTERVIVSPQLQSLNAQLAEARGIYSDTHPKVKLIQRRISAALHASSNNPTTGVSDTAAAEQIAVIDDLMLQHANFETETHRLEQAVTNAAALNEIALEKLGAVQAATDANRIKLKIVEDAALSGRNPETTRRALLVSLTVASCLAAIATVAVRIKLDGRLRRPHDLQCTLGLTPFATLPNLGPSLG